MGGLKTQGQVNAWLTLVLACLLIQVAQGAQCGIAICYVVDASSSINSIGTNPQATFQNIVKPFLRDLTTSIQAFAGGSAEFGGAIFGTGASDFQATMTSSVAALNTSISNIACPIPVSSGGCAATQCRNAANQSITGTGGCFGGQTQFTNMDAGIDNTGRISAGPLPEFSAEQPVQFSCWYGSTDPASGITNTGGTDVTPGPDGMYYRWCAKDTNMEYTGTRYSTRVVNGYNQLSGAASGMFVSNKLSTQTATDPMATFSNAGAFCTNRFVVGTGAFVRPKLRGGVDNPESGSYAHFYSYGMNNGQQGRGFGLTALGLGTSPLPSAQLLSRTIVVRKPDGSPATDALRVNGAAVRPVCSF